MAAGDVQVFLLRSACDLLTCTNAVGPWGSNPPGVGAVAPGEPPREHTTITLLAQAGVPRDIIALIVGHDDPAFTERVCTHINTETARSASAALQSVFGGRRS